MNKFIYLIICSFLFSTPFHSFELNENSKMLSRSNGSFPDSNGIIDIEYYYPPNNFIGTQRTARMWVGTGAGLGKITLPPHGLVF